MERKAIFVSPETHKELKILSAVNQLTFDKLIQALMKKEL